MKTFKSAAATIGMALAVAACSDDAPTHPSLTGLSVPVSSAAELQAALSVADGTRNIVLGAGEYELASTLVVPDGTTLTGAGTMAIDHSSHLPTGFEAGTGTVLKAASTLVGDVVVLGDGSALKRLTVQDALGRTGGSAVVVHSRHAGDHVRATLEDCEIVNPNPPSSSLQSVGGRALVLLTRNRETITSTYAPEVGASVIVDMTHCIIRSPLIAGVFVNNFSPEASTKLVVTENVLGGGVQVSGGTSRPDAVTGSSATLESRGNLYRPDPGASLRNGLQVYGGAGLPTPGIVASAVTSNTAILRSVDDRIEGFVNAIVARGGSRPLASTSEISSNSATVALHGATLSSIGGDLNLAGASSLVVGSWSDAGNLLRVSAERVTGSGQRNNFYGDVAGPPSTTFGAGNRLEIVGTLQAFFSSNSGILPLPPEGFFVGAH